MTAAREIGDLLVRQTAGGDQSVSVIVPTYNRAHLLGRAVRSIQVQTHRPAEIIIVDDCSTDGTASAISVISGEVPLINIRMEKNGGGAVARNAGILRAKSAYVAFLDSDDEWLPDHLQTLLSAAADCDGDFVVAGSALRIGKKPRVLPGRAYPQAGDIAAKLHFVLSAPLAFQSSTLLMPRETARRYMFDSHLRRHQDWDLAFRMIRNDVVLFLLPDATTKYYTPLITSAGNVGISRSLLPSLRFLAKHQAGMSARSRARFVTLQVMRRRGKGVGVVKYLLWALMIGGLGPKEFVYYVCEALMAGDPRLPRPNR